MFKLRFYEKKGINKGKVNHEEFFKTLEELNERYEQVFVYSDFSLNPTAWKLNSSGSFERILGY